LFFRWFHEQHRSSAEQPVSIVKALQDINPEAAKEFVRLYISEMVEEED
jgi:hypothetical protein